jgi:hypothetical protein
MSDIVLIRPTVTGKIAAILDKSTVVINRGRNHDIKRGDEFYIYSLLGPFIDPDTGEDLGTTTKVWGKVIVSTLEDKFCIASTDVSLNLGSFLSGTNWGALFSGSKIQLPVEESDITKHVEKIKVGFLAISPELKKEIQVKTIEEPQKETQVLSDSNNPDKDDDLNEGETDDQGAN